MFLKCQLINYILFCFSGVPGSYVSGSIVDGLFQGRIVTGNTTFYVERANRYIDSRDSSNHDFHSVIYSSGDIVDPYAKRRTGHQGGCGLTEHQIDKLAQMSQENEVGLC